MSKPFESPSNKVDEAVREFKASVSDAVGKDHHDGCKFIATGVAGSASDLKFTRSNRRAIGVELNRYLPRV
jgi:hypothetical protein